MQSRDSSEYRVQTVLSILVPLKLPVTQSQQREVKVFTPIHAQTQSEQQWQQQPQTARAFWESDAVFLPSNTAGIILQLAQYEQVHYFIH